MPLFGPPDIAKLKSRRDVKALLAALKYREAPSIRRAAALALAEISLHLTEDKLEQLISPLMSALDDPDPSVLPAAALALGGIGRPAVLPLISALRSPKDRVRDGAARALGQLSKRLNEPAYLRLPVEPLVGLLTDPAPQVRRSAAWALGRFAPRLDSAARGLPVEALIQRLKDETPEVREAAVVALGRICDGRAIPPLIRALEDLSATVRKVTAEALTELGWQPTNNQENALLSIAIQDWNRASQADLSDILPLQRALQDPQPAMREAAVVALGQTGNTTAVNPLIVALEDSHPNVRRAAALALEQIARAPNTAQAFITALRGTARDTRRTLLQAISLMSDPTAIPPLVSALSSVENDLAGVASKILVTFGGPAVSAILPLLNHPEQSVRNRAADVLVKIGNPAVPLILELLRNSPRHVCELAVNILGKIRDPRAVAPLINLLNNPLLASSAAHSLGQIGDLRALQPLGALLESDNAAIRQAATLALGNLGDPRVIDHMIGMLHAEDRVTRQNAAQVLIQMVRSEKLNMDQKRMILAQSERISEKHVDHQSHVDNAYFSEGHRDEAFHLDTGIGLDPPAK